MDFGSINLIAKDADKALITYLKLFGTNNVQEVIRLQELKDDTETVEGQFKHTSYVYHQIRPPRRMTP